jgi:hypothetical protein
MTTDIVHNNVQDAEWTQKKAFVPKTGTQITIFGIQFWLYFYEGCIFTWVLHTVRIKIHKKEDESKFL